MFTEAQLIINSGEKKHLVVQHPKSTLTSIRWMTIIASCVQLFEVYKTYLNGSSHCLSDRASEPMRPNIREQEGRIPDCPWLFFKERVLFSLLVLQCSNESHQMLPPQADLLGWDVETDSFQDIMTCTFKHSFKSCPPQWIKHCDKYRFRSSIWLLRMMMTLLHTQINSHH